jgi:hypothetical protein
MIPLVPALFVGACLFLLGFSMGALVERYRNTRARLRMLDDLRRNFVPRSELDKDAHF